MDNKKNKSVFKKQDTERITNDNEINDILTSMGKKTPKGKSAATSSVAPKYNKSEVNASSVIPQDDSDTNKKYKKNGYDRPDITYTDQLSKEQVEEKLQDYKKIDDIFKVPLGVHMRYFIKKDGQLLFRLGGQFHKNTGLPDYVILTNGKTQWSVQVKDTIFYVKMTLPEIKEEYENIIKGLIEKNKKLKQRIKELE
jgi:hypothetical protein